MTEPYPEHTKLESIRDKSQAIGAFLDDTPYTLCITVDGELRPAPGTIEQILADYFDINLRTLEREKRQMLAEMRKARE